MRKRIALLRQSAKLQRATFVLRLLLGFAFLPAGLKKVLGQPFTDAANSGPFHDFLDAFLATGGFYRFVGVMQLVGAVLLLTQRFAHVGALIMAPILTAILVFCWSTGVIPTASVVTLMMLGLGWLLVWDSERFRVLFAAPGTEVHTTVAADHPDVDRRLWGLCGMAIIALYVGNTLVTGNVYRPRGAEWSNPSFSVLVAIAVLPFVTYAIERRRRAR